MAALDSPGGVYAGTGPGDPLAPDANKVLARLRSLRAHLTRDADATPHQYLRDHPSENYPSQMYPSGIYPSQDYPPRNHPSPDYPSQDLPFQKYPSQSYPSHQPLYHSGLPRPHDHHRPPGGDGFMARHVAVPPERITAAAHGVQVNASPWILSSKP